MTGLIATACGDNTLRVFKENFENGTSQEPSFDLVASVASAHEEDINAVAWNPKIAGLLASCSDDTTIKLWQIEDTL